MQIVAINNIHTRQDDVALLAKKLAEVLGTTPYEARMRINISGGGPAIVATFASHEQASACVELLHDCGFTTIDIDSAALETDQNRFIVKRFSLNEQSLQLISIGGKQLDVSFSEVTLLLRGAGIISSVQSETTTKKKFAVGRALASGGLMMRKKVTTTTTTVKDERQPFCHIYAPGLPPIVLRQDLLDYTALGSQCQLSREANFSWICNQLRNLCAAAKWNDSLQTKAGVAQLLGPVFNPENDLDLAISIVATSHFTDQTTGAAC